MILDPEIPHTNYVIDLVDQEIPTQNIGCMTSEWEQNSYVN